MRLSSWPCPKLGVRQKPDPSKIIKKKETSPFTCWENQITTVSITFHMYQEKMVILGIGWTTYHFFKIYLKAVWRNIHIGANKKSLKNHKAQNLGERQIRPTQHSQRTRDPQFVSNGPSICWQLPSLLTILIETACHQWKL